MFSANGAAGMNNVDVRRRRDRRDEHDRVRRVRRRGHPLRGALRRAAKPTSRTSRWTASHELLRHAGACTALVGYSEAEHDNPVQTTLLFDRADVDGYSYDYRGNSRLPVITYGNVDVTNPATWTLSQIRLRPQSSTNTFQTASFDVAWDVTDAITLKAGPQYKKFEFETESLQRSNGTPTNQEAVDSGERRGDADRRATASIARSAAISTRRRAASRRWLIPDLRRGRAAVQPVRPLRLPPRHRAGARATTTRSRKKTSAASCRPTSRPKCSGRAAARQPRRALRRDRADLVRLHVHGRRAAADDGRAHLQRHAAVAESSRSNVTDSFIIRAAAAKVMARPNGGGQTTGLGILAPGAAVDDRRREQDRDRRQSGARSVSRQVVRPRVRVVLRARTRCCRWRCSRRTSSSFVQIVRCIGQFLQQHARPAGQRCARGLRCRDSRSATCLVGWQFNLPTNTDGGDVKGFEISYQQPFSFLPGFFSHFGVILNYTGVESEIEYLSPPVIIAGVPQPQVTVKDDLTGLSKCAYNATLYWENEIFSARVSAAYRDDYLTTVPGRNNNDVEGTIETLNIDFSATWTVMPALDLTLEALNLTDEFQDQYVGSAGRSPLVLPPPGSPVPARRPLQVLRPPKRLGAGSAHAGPGAAFFHRGIDRAYSNLFFWVPRCLLAGAAVHAHEQRDLGRETLHSDNGWAASGSGVTGGSAAVDAQIYTVTNRAELIAALNNGVTSSTSPSNPSNEPKIIYVQRHDRRRTSTMPTSRSRAPTTTATASRSKHSSRRTIRPCGAASRRAVPLEAARVASQTGAAGARAHPPRLEHDDRRPRPRRDDPRRLVRHPRHGERGEQPHATSSCAT